MDSLELYSNIRRKGSFLCIGLDTDLALLPSDIKEREYPLFEFNKGIIDSTHKFAVAYKPNLAFYEAEGWIGIKQLEMTVDYLRSVDNSLFLIADAKRGDIGNTAKRYAHAFFNRMDFDAVTLAPYMGSDSILPFLEYKDRWAVILALTSNPSAEDFETLKLESNSQPLYKKVIERFASDCSYNNTMFVVGATRPESLAEIRSLCPNHFFLVPGVGTQGGTVEEVALNGMNSRCGLLVNVSRDILYAYIKNGTPNEESAGYIRCAAEAASSIAGKMAAFL